MEILYNPDDFTPPTEPASNYREGTIVKLDDGTHWVATREYGYGNATTWERIHDIEYALEYPLA